MTIQELYKIALSHKLEIRLQIDCNGICFIFEKDVSGVDKHTIFNLTSDAILYAEPKAIEIIILEAIEDFEKSPKQTSQINLPEHLTKPTGTIEA